LEERKEIKRKINDGLNWLYVINSNLHDHSKFQHFKKIRLLGAKLLAKIKLEFSNAEVSFFYTSQSQE
jgi:hypothetical protein